MRVRPRLVIPYLDEAPCSATWGLTRFGSVASLTSPMRSGSASAPRPTASWRLRDGCGRVARPALQRLGLLLWRDSDERLRKAKSDVWAILDSNQGPLPYQRSALTN